MQNLKYLASYLSDLHENVATMRRKVQRRPSTKREDPAVAVIEDDVETD